MFLEQEMELINDLIVGLQDLAAIACDVKEMSDKLKKEGFTFDKWPDEIKEKYDKAWWEFYDKITDLGFKQDRGSV